MLFSSDLYIGIDPSPGKRSIAYAALNPDLEPVSLGQGNLQTVLAFVAGQHSATLGVHGPAAPNQSILTDAERRSQFLIPLTKGRPGNMRVAEYKLGHLGLPVYRTPAHVEDAPTWMQTAFVLYAELNKQGYQPYQAGTPAKRQYLEVVPEICYRAWLPGDILAPNTLHGRMQRQLALYEMDIVLADPMSFFEEVTRYRILQGKLPNEQILSNTILQALAAAYTAWLACHQPQEIALVGIRQEGQIAVPAKLLSGDVQI